MDTTALFEHVKGLGVLFLPPKNKLEMHHVAPEFKFRKLFFIETNNQELAMVYPLFLGVVGK